MRANGENDETCSADEPDGHNGRSCASEVGYAALEAARVEADGSCTASTAITWRTDCAAGSATRGFEQALLQMHRCLRLPWPPNLGLSRQLLHLPQSLSVQPSHLPQGTLRAASVGDDSRPHSPNSSARSGTSTATHR